MKKITILMFLVTITSCTNVLDKPISKENLLEVKDIILSNKENKPLKNKYIWDNLSEQVGYLEMGKALKIKNSVGITFRQEISELSTKYDSIKKSKELIKKNNKSLKDFVKLVDSKTIYISKHKGFLNMKLKFNNTFEKEILYAILNYKYVDKYDSKFFDRKTKLTDEVANGFNGEVEISTTEKYNNVANFIYSKVPQDRMKEYLMEGLKVNAVKIVFTDKSEIIAGNEDWEYLE